MKITEVIGSPIIAYHGTTDNISQFRPLTHFGTEKAARDRMDYKKNATGKIYKVQLDIHNPFTIKDFPGIHYDRVYAFDLRDKKLLSQEEMENITMLQDPVELRAALIAKVRELGYDGFVYKNRYEDKGNISYVILDSSQVKVLDVTSVGQVKEAFDQPYKLKWEAGDYGDVDALAKMDDGNYLSIMFNKGYNQDKEEAWNVEFFRNNSQEVTGEGDQQRVFATVLSAIQKFIKKYKPNKIIFSASKEVDDGQKSQSRARLYDSLVQRYAKAWGFRAFRAETGNKVIYELTRIKPIASKPVPEARSNSEQNIKAESGMKELEAIANTISDPENWAISMTSEPKLGINPQVGISEDTPKGIYFYPLNYVLGKIHSRKPLPWANDYPYIQLFQYDRSGEMTQQTQVDPAKLKQALSKYCSPEIMQQAEEEDSYDGTPYWYIYDCLSRLGKNDETNIIRWNKVLRDLGFTSVFDPGRGWIAENEPTQGVVLDPRIIKQHKTIANRKESNVVTPALIAKSLFDEIDMELSRNRIWKMYDPDGSKLKQAIKKYAMDPKFKPYIGKKYSQELEDKIKGYRLYGARQLSDVAMEWYKAQQEQKSAAESVDENFADGKVKGKSRPGRVKRAGASCAGSVTDLRAKAKKYGGEKGKMYHWCANMKGGKK